MRSKFPSLELDGRDVVLDASVFINLLATEIPGKILQGLGVKAFVEERTLAEVTRHPVPYHDLATTLEGLFRSGLLTLGKLNGAGHTLFYELVANDIVGGLDDGESATIAFAITQGLLATIDEKKATRIMRERWPSSHLANTVTLLAQQKLVNFIGRDMLSSACCSAARYGRMHIPSDAKEWFATVVGNARVGKENNP